MSVATVPNSSETPRDNGKLASKPSSSPCLLPILEGKQTRTDENGLDASEMSAPVSRKTQENLFDRDRTFITAGSDFIPEDILNSLTQMPVPPPSREQLGPPSKHKKLKPIEVSTPPRRRPANVWNFPRNREKFKHLTDQPPCTCGAGRDISFLYDVASASEKKKSQSPDRQVRQQAEPTAGLREGSEKKNMLGPGNVSQNTDMAPVSEIPDSLVPSEYHIVKNPGVVGLEFHDDKYSTYVKSHEDHLTVFPSMKPAGRQEVLKLKHAMDSMLARAGVDDEAKELTGPTQIHNLLELVKKEQNIYNVCFNEIIRQVTVECAERGEILADLRKRYGGLLDRVPRQVKSLHQEVVAQRALDRRLTEELVRFKASISSLTSELASVKAHDREVTQQAISAQQELRTALEESDKNTSLLAEYHELYELQRKRLEGQVAKLTEERDLWGSAAYTLALKVTDRHSLSTAKKLHLFEKAWAKLVRHFAIFLSERDSIQLENLTEHVQKWRELAEAFNKEIDETDEDISERLNSLIGRLQRWKIEFEKVVNYDYGSVKVPDEQFIRGLCEDLKHWEEVLNHVAEKFTGETLLSREDELYNMNQQVDGWTDVALKVFGRHQAPDGTRWPQHTEMQQLNQVVDRLHQQYHVRVTGENGVAKGIIDLVNPIETWGNKLNAILKGGEMILDNDWIRLCDMVSGEWIEHMLDVISMIGSTQKEGERLAGQPENKVDVERLFKDTMKWLGATTNGIDNEDGKIVQRVSQLHSSMIRWIVTVLLRLVPDVEDKRLDEINKVTEDLEVDASLGGGQILLESTSEEIVNRVQTLSEELRKFSITLTNCCSDLVIDLMQEKRDAGDEHADLDFKDLKRLSAECDGWIRTAKLLTQEALGDEFVVEESAASVQKSRSQVEDGDAVTATPESNVALSVEPSSKEENTAETPDQAARPATAESQKEQTTTETKDEARPASVAKPDEQEGEVEKTEEPGNEEGESEVPDVAEQGEASQMHVLGHDDNIRTKSLKDLPQDQDAELLLVPEEGALPGRSPSPDTKKALEALAAVERLQTQLLETEERAQASEERAIQAEGELKQALERIRALERSASRASALTPSGEAQTPAGRPVSTSSDAKRPPSQASSTAQKSGAHTPRTASQQSTRPSTRTSSKKK